MSLREAALRLRESINIVDLISEFVALKKRGRNYVGLCPFHSETKPSFTVSEEKQIFYCFGCGAGGDVIGFYMRVNGLSFGEAVRELARRYHLPLPSELRESAESGEHRELYRINERAVRFFERMLGAPEGKAAREYLRGRGLSEDLRRTFLLGYAPSDGGALTSHLRLAGVDLALAEKAGVLARREDGTYYDRFRGRLIFPIRDLSGRVVAFGGRIVGEGEPKYLNSPESPIYHKSRVLYGLYEARPFIREKGHGLVVEGYFDLLSLWEHGFRHTVATCGTALTEDHVRLLKRFSRDWYLVFDGDEAGRKAAARAVGLFFSQGLFPRVVFLPEGEDPDSLVRKAPAALSEALEQAEEPLSFLVEYLLRIYGRGPEGKAQVVREIREILGRLPDPVLRHEYLRRAARKLDLPEGLLLSPRCPQRETLSQEREGAPWGRLLLQFLLQWPSRAEELAALSPEEFLEDPEKTLYEEVLSALREGISPERLTFVEGILQSLFSELLFSPPLEASPEEVLAQIRAWILRRRFEAQARDLRRTIRELEARGRHQEVAGLLRAYTELCRRFPKECQGEGVYEPLQKGS
ncbi:DNA primase [Thermosulfurimonas marina]|uniref:DNA primase n=1 Tax=Thermosulfurimonas marina TaxID=2047767 RepID=A0A6H1WSX9_9BACT|nr:DNA primase [Thermosulfurimonas marina]QJA06259.1 DNA primase [Thermosulfurimonas marina]